MELSLFPIVSNTVLSIAISIAIFRPGIAQPIAMGVKIDNKLQTIEGLSGGSIDSKGCGFIAEQPNYVIQLSQRVDYMRLSVKTTGGQPTLLVLGPNPGDSFCVLGDLVSGLKPEMSGVWEAGEYKIYVGDRLGENYPFTLNISTQNN
jgi:hypothetical protein